MMCFGPMGFARFRFFHRAMFLVTRLLAFTGSGRGQTALDLGGRRVNPLTAVSRKIVVLVFLRRDWPENIILR